MKLLRITGISIGVVAIFAAGMIFQDHRVKNQYIKVGKVEATWDQVFDGYMLYLTCLKDDCSAERRIGDQMVAKGKARLKDLGEDS